MPGDHSKIKFSNDQIPFKVYFFIFSILAFTGFEYFYRAGYLFFPIALYAFICYFSKTINIDKSVFFIIISFGYITLAQTYLGSNRSIFTFFVFVISLFGYYFISKIIGSNFIDAFINVVYAISLISLPFFFLTYYEPFMNLIIEKIAIHFQPIDFSSESSNFFNTQRSNILIYNFANYSSSYNRNSGPFWEPGMYVVFLNIALFFNLLKKSNLRSFKNIILISTIVTTFSTTGYLGMCFILIVFILFYSTSRFKFIYILIVVIFSNYIFKLDFMQDKIFEQINVAHESGSSRFGAMLVHLKIIIDNPIFGVGNGITRYVSNYSSANSTANGLTLVFVQYGIPLGIIYYILLLKSCLNIMKGYLAHNQQYLGYSFFILLLLLAFSQDITVRPLYFFLIIWGIFIPVRININKYKKKKSQLSN